MPHLAPIMWMTLVPIMFLTLITYTSSQWWSSPLKPTLKIKHPSSTLFSSWSWT